MKKLILIYGLLLSVSLFAGPSISNGPQGFEFVHCEGILQVNKSQKVNVILSVAAHPKYGLLASVGFVETSHKGLFYSVKKIDNDPRGTLYQDASGKEKISILVPNMQNYQLPSGIYNTILTLPEISKSSAILTCSK